jgi:hypothetical protein
MEQSLRRLTLHGHHGSEQWAKAYGAYVVSEQSRLGLEPLFKLAHEALQALAVHGAMSPILCRHCNLPQHA